MNGCSEESLDHRTEDWGIQKLGGVAAKNDNENQMVTLLPSRRPLHSGTPDLTRPRTSDSVKSQVRLQLDIWCPPAPGLIRPGDVFANLPPVRIF